jgi:hypothetical protein
MASNYVLMASISRSGITFPIGTFSDRDAAIVAIKKFVDVHGESVDLYTYKFENNKVDLNSPPIKLTKDG